MPLQTHRPAKKFPEFDGTIGSAPNAKENGCASSVSAWTDLQATPLRRQERNSDAAELTSGSSW
jgi:hypothetical protein